MKKRTINRDAGSSLVVVFILILMILALLGAVVPYSLYNHRSAIESRDRAISFYLAESAIERAKWEIAEDEDPDTDGIGNVNWTGSHGSYTITAQDLGGGDYMLNATGNSGDETQAIENVVNYATTINPPIGAISIPLDSDTILVQMRNETNLIVDGNGTPGIVLSDDSTYNDFGREFDNGVDDGFISETDITGSVTNTFNGSDLSIDKIAASDMGVDVPSTIHSDLRTHIDTNYYSPATSQTLSGSATWGSPGSPVLYKFSPGSKLSSGTVSGHGTLVFSNNMEIESGATINWNGDIIIYGDNSNDANLIVDGTLNVTGNIIVVAGDNRNLKFENKINSDVDVTGAVTLLSDNTNETKIEFYVENDFTLNGTMTQIASIHQTEFKGDDSNVDIRGFYLIDGPPTGQAKEVKLKIEEDCEIVHDPAQFQVGYSALNSVGIDLGFGSGSGSSGGTFTSISWRRLSE